MSMCEVNRRRASMSDGEFWEDVSRSLGTGPDAVEFEDENEQRLDYGTCNVCGEAGACAWDAEGRPLIHADHHQK